MILTRWSVIILMGSLLFVSGCGQDEEPVATPTPETTETTPGDTSEEATESSESELTEIKTKLTVAYKEARAASVSNTNGNFTTKSFTAEDLAASIESSNPQLGPIQVAELDTPAAEQDLATNQIFMKAKAEDLSLGYRTDHGETVFLIVEDGGAVRLVVGEANGVVE